jgi:adenosylcobinamide kinase / adenosylcobinamide-phosphate guanylyltransferase
VTVTLVLGGARSGKSAVAERRAGARGAVTYLATGDAVDMRERVAAHRARRPSTWATVETVDVVAVLSATTGTVLVDSLTTWVARAPGFAVDVDQLCRTLSSRVGDTVVVSDEVGLGVHPSTEVGRSFRDALGLVNQAVAAVAHEVLLVVAGRALVLGTVV